MPPFMPPRASTRRVLLATPLGLMAYFLAEKTPRRAATSAILDRDQIARIERGADVPPPFTLAMARVVLRPGASSRASTAGGVRMIVVESGEVAIATRHTIAPLSAAELTFAANASAAVPDTELIVPAGTTMTFDVVGVASLRNPAARSAVVLDAVAYPGEPKPLARGFTTDEGVSFQLLASANAVHAFAGRVVVILERLRIGPSVELPDDLSRGQTLMYLEAGTLQLVPRTGTIYSARAAAAAPYALSGALKAIGSADHPAVTAGGSIFIPMGAEAAVTNVSGREVEVLTLAIREGPDHGP